MEKIITVTFKLRGTKKQIEIIEDRIASLKACEKVVCLYVREVSEYRARGSNESRPGIKKGKGDKK